MVLTILGASVILPFQVSSSQYQIAVT